MTKPTISLKFDVSDILHTNGYRVTSTRVSILNVLLKAKKPLSIQEIISACKPHSLDIVTVYRALEAFASSHLVRRVDLQHGHVDYEFISDDHHHHIICKKCGTVEDFKTVECDALTKKISHTSHLFKQIDDHSMELFGICKQCA